MNKKYIELCEIIWFDFDGLCGAKSAVKKSS